MWVGTLCCAVLSAGSRMHPCSAASPLTTRPATCTPALPAANQAAGTRRLAASTSKGPREGRGSLGGGGGSSTAATMQRRQEMLRGINSGDAVLLLGGDLNVTVVSAQVGRRVARGITPVRLLQAAMQAGACGGVAARRRPCSPLSAPCSTPVLLGAGPVRQRQGHPPLCPGLHHRALPHQRW